MLASGSTPSDQTTTPLTRFTITEYHMGGDAKIILYAPTEDAALRACETAFKKIAELEQIMSDYRPTSELMQFCAKPKGTKTRLSDDLYRVLERCQEISVQTEGQFDCTVGPLVKLWRKARKSKVLPALDEIKAAKELVGYEKLHLDLASKTGWLDTDRMQLDLGGIAKGYAADAAIYCLKKSGVKSAMIEMGGDLVLAEAPPNSAGWEIEIPNAKKTFRLKNCAVSSSGDTEQFVEIDGKRYSHVVNIRTGYGLSDRIQATVIAKNGFSADPISTALTLVDARLRDQLVMSYPGTEWFLKAVLN